MKVTSCNYGNAYYGGGRGTAYYLWSYGHGYGYGNGSGFVNSFGYYGHTCGHGYGDYGICYGSIDSDGNGDGNYGVCYGDGNGRGYGMENVTHPVVKDMLQRLIS